MFRTVVPGAKKKESHGVGRITDQWGDEREIYLSRGRVEMTISYPGGREGYDKPRGD